MTTAGQALLFAGEAFCLTFAAIALVYFADRLRSDFLRSAKRVLAEARIGQIARGKNRSRQISAPRRLGADMRKRLNV